MARWHIMVACVLALGCSGCATSGEAGSPLPKTSGKPEHCVASVFDEGSRLADGSAFSKRRSRAEVLVAHKTHPLGSRVLITHVGTGQTLVAHVRDRGPFVRGRCVDLSVAAAARLGISGIAHVRVDLVQAE